MTQIDDLVKMGDRETLYELMTEDDEWLTRLESAEGLIELGDQRGYEFLISVTMGDDEEMLEVANEILASPQAMKMKRQIESEQQAERRIRIGKEAPVAGRKSLSLQNGTPAVERIDGRRPVQQGI